METAVQEARRFEPTAEDKAAVLHLYRQLRSFYNPVGALRVMRASLSDHAMQYVSLVGMVPPGFVPLRQHTATSDYLRSVVDRRPVRYWRQSPAAGTAAAW